MRYTSHVTRSLKIILHRLQIIGHHHGNDWIRTTSYLLCVLLLLEQLGVCMCLHGTPPGKAPPWNIPSINTSHTSHSSPPTSTSSLPVVSLKYISDNQEYSCEGELCLGNQHGIDAIICAGNAGKSESAQDRVRILRRTRLDFCDRYLAYNALDLHQCDIANVPERQCRMCFQALLQREALAKQAYVNFLEVLAKFDCRENFSTWSCESCQMAYKDWLCAEAVELPFYLNHQSHTHRVSPCPDYCLQVQKRCPYFLPHLHNQYAGEPLFLCTDFGDFPEPVDALQDSTMCHRPCDEPSAQNSICTHNYTLRHISSSPLSSHHNYTQNDADSSSSERFKPLTILIIAQVLFIVWRTSGPIR